MAKPESQWERIEVLFDQALERPVDERLAFVREACGDDHTLRREVESLLAEIDDAQTDSFLRQPALTAFADADPTDDPLGLIGKAVAHYHVLEHLGSGGMGVVYKAKDTRLKRTAALKFLPPELMRAPQARDRFLREAQAAAALDHGNICTVYEIGETAGRLFIAMACIEGQTLRQKLEQEPLPVGSVLDVAIQVAAGLEAAHERGIVHRDIKPGNVMVTPKGQVKVMDFGLAKWADSMELTRSGSTLGTVAYMSPEQARGELVDHRTDIWSLGVVLYEMLTGQRPFRGDYTQAVIYAILNQEPEPATRLRADIPIALDHVLCKALAKDAAERYQRVDELLSELTRLKQGATRHQPGTPREHAIPDLLPYMSDRTELLYLLDKAVSEQNDRPDQPLVCIVHGDNAQCHDKLQQRLQDHELPHFLNLDTRSVRLTAYHLEWPRHYTTRDAFHERLTWALSRSIFRRMAMKEDICDFFAALPAPVMIYSQLLVSEWQRYGDAVLQDFFQYWQTWPRHTSSQRLLIFLFIKYHHNPALSRINWLRRWRMDSMNANLLKSVDRLQEKAFDGIFLRVLPKLEGITQQDVENWATQYGHLHLLREIKTLFQQHEARQGKTSMPMEVIAARLQEIMHIYQPIHRGIP